MKDKLNNSREGVFPTFLFLTVIFVVLKFLNVINWSWWWVLSPIWILIVLSILIPVIGYTAVLSIPVIFDIIRIFSKGKKGGSKTNESKATDTMVKVNQPIDSEINLSETELSELKNKDFGEKLAWIMQQTKFPMGFDHTQEIQYIRRHCLLTVLIS